MDADNFPKWGPPGDLLVDNARSVNYNPDHKTIVSSSSDDYGRKICGEHLGTVKECHTGDTEKEQLRAQFRGIISQRLHHGAPQARRTPIHRTQRSGYTAFGKQSEK